MTHQSRFAPKPTAAPRRNVISAEVYTCPELAPFTGRAGSQDAFRYPSVIAGVRIVPKHHAVDHAGLPANSNN